MVNGPILKLDLGLKRRMFEKTPAFLWKSQGPITTPPGTVVNHGDHKPGFLPRIGNPSMPKTVVTYENVSGFGY